MKYNIRGNKIEVTDAINDYIKSKVSKLEKNAYFRNYDFPYAKNTNDFIVNNKDELINIYYTIVNSGMNDFTFYCSPEYSSCTKDVYDLANDVECASMIIAE